MRSSLRALAHLVVLALVAATLSLGVGAASGAAPGQAKPGDRSGTKPSAAALAEPGTIAGTVTTPDDGYVYGQLQVYKWQAEGEYFDLEYGETLDEESPATYSVPAEPGDYYVAFHDLLELYQTAYSGGATQPPASLEDTGVINVAPGEGADADIALIALPSRQTVSGIVQNLDGEPLSAYYLEVYKDLGEADGAYVTDLYGNPDGTYSVDLRPGDYTLRFYDDSGDYENTTASVTVADGPVAMDPIVLPPIGRYAVGGTITDTSGPISGATVRLYRLYGTPGNWETYEWTDEVTTDDDGQYSFTGVRGSGRYYTVWASAPGHTARYLGGFANAGDTEGFIPTADVMDANVELPASSTVSGTVSGPTGSAESVQVQLYRWYPEDDSGYFDQIDETYTDADGHYSFQTLDPGFYTLRFETDDTSDPLEPAWLVGTDAPAGTDAPGVFEVTETAQAFTKDKTLAASRQATGTVTDQAGAPLDGASVVAYLWDAESESWGQYATGVTDADGTFGVRIPASSVVTFRFARGGFAPIFYGGDTELPATPGEGNSLTTPADADVPLGTIELPPFVSKLGKVAGQDLAFCREHALAANDDESTAAVEIPFDLKFFGTEYETLYVNNNGNVTFNSDLSDFTPEDLTGATNRPMIAPFFADVDTRALGSNTVTYGASPDGKTFCVNWADVGYYSRKDDKLNTFQLLLTENTTGAGRTEGDFDITINYDEILWETGSASGGTDGFGGTSAAAGFTAGTGVSGTYVQLPGSLVNGGLLDGGPNSLVAGSQNSGHDGRYVYQVRNEGLTSSFGGLGGLVVEDDGDEPVEDAYVQACQGDGTGCSYAYTDTDGHYTFTALPVGGYDIRVWPPSDALFGGGATATVTSGEDTTVPEIRLAAPQPPPAGTTITSNGASSNGVPSVFYGEDLDLVVTGCAAVASPTYTVTLADGTVLRDHLPMTEAPAGTYQATIPQFYPNHGEAVISTNVPVSCGGEPVVFNVYIDPSGVVTDQWGRPIQGATATLLRSDTSGGEYTMVPDGSDIMSPANRSNPTVTNSVGYFQWDVQVGWYKVTLAATSCVTATTPAMEVPPERIDLLVALTCSSAAPTPTAGPSIAGQLKVGSAVSPVAATWAAPLVAAASQTKLLRNGSPVTLTGGSYTLRPEDVGASFSVSSTGVRPDYVQEEGAGSTVTFTPVTVTSTPQVGAAGDAPTATANPSITGTPKVGQTLTASPGTWSASGLGFAYQWSRAGAPIAGATTSTYTPVVADAAQALTVTVTASRAGHPSGSATSAATTVAKLTSSVTAKLKPAKVKVGAKAKLSGTLLVPGVAAPVGTLTVFDGKKKLLTVKLTAKSKGAYKVTLKKLKAGKHKLTVRYAGSSTVAGSSSKAVTLKVVKPKKKK